MQEPATNQTDCAKGMLSSRLTHLFNSFDINSAATRARAGSSSIDEIEWVHLFCQPRYFRSMSVLHGMPQTLRGMEGAVLHERSASYVRKAMRRHTSIDNSNFDRLFNSIAAIQASRALESSQNFEERLEFVEDSFGAPESLGLKSTQYCSEETAYCVV